MTPMRGWMLYLALLLSVPAAAQDVPDFASVDGLDAAAACAAAKSAAQRAFLPAAAGKAASGASAHFDATFYHLTLDLRFASENAGGGYLLGRTRVEGRVTGAPLRTLVLDLEHQRRQPSNYGDTLTVGMKVTAVRTIDGTPLPYAHADNLLRIDLPATQPVGAVVAVEIDYEGLPARGGFGHFVFGTLGDGSRYAWSLSQPYGARAWWPNKDQPSDKADSVRVTVTVPAPMRVGSNGLLRGEPTTTDGRTTFDWVSHYPIASYLVSVAAADYDAFEQRYDRPDSLAAVFGPLALPILHYAYPETNAFEGTSVLDGWRRVVDILPVLEHWFGPYPFPAEKYGHAHVTFGGGMEHQTMSSMGNNGIGLITHELAHMWFGDAVTMATWPHLWLNEGFATYSEVLLWEDFAGRYPEVEEYRAAYDYIFNLYRGRARNAQGTLIVEDTTYVPTLFSSSRVYSKGGMVLHMLRHVIGDEAFRTTLRTYTQNPALRYGTATTDDFQRIAEAVSGRDLGAFFRQWVTEGTGYPVYAVRWTQEPRGNGATLRVTVEQAQTATLSNTPVFIMPITLAVETRFGEQHFTVENDQRTQTYTFQLAAPATNVVFDPDADLLRNDRVPVEQAVGAEEVPEALQTDLLGVFPDPAPGAFSVRFVLARPGPVRLALYDVLGRRVRVLLETSQPAGMDERLFEVPGLAAGSYVLRLETPERTATRLVSMVNGQ